VNRRQVLDRRSGDDGDLVAVGNDGERHVERAVLAEGVGRGVAVDTLAVPELDEFLVATEERLSVLGAGPVDRPDPGRLIGCIVVRVELVVAPALGLGLVVVQRIELVDLAAGADVQDILWLVYVDLRAALVGRALEHRGDARHADCVVVGRVVEGESLPLVCAAVGNLDVGQLDFTVRAGEGAVVGAPGRVLVEVVDGLPAAVLVDRLD